MHGSHNDSNPGVTGVHASVHTGVNQSWKCTLAGNQACGVKPSHTSASAVRCGHGIRMCKATGADVRIIVTPATPFVDPPCKKQGNACILCIGHHPRATGRHPVTCFLESFAGTLEHRWRTSGPPPHHLLIPLAKSKEIHVFCA